MTVSKFTLLVVDDEPYILPTLQALLSGDFHVLTADSADAVGYGEGMGCFAVMVTRTAA